MPQMSPMLWSLLFIYFLFIFIIFNILNYFNFIPLINQKEINNTTATTNKTLNWKW